MATDEEEEYNRQLIERTKWARRCTGLTQKKMGGALGLGQGTWKQYETRTPIPQYLIERFCTIARCDMPWLITGDGPAPKMPPDLSPHKVRRAPGRARR